MTIAAPFPGGPAPVGTVLFSNTFGAGTSYFGVVGYSTDSNHDLIAKVSSTGPQAGALAGGTHIITAKYSGDNFYYASASVTLNQVVQQQVTNSKVTTTASSSSAGSAVTLTDTVTGVNQAAGTVPPTGEVTFMSGSSKLGTMPLVTTNGTTAASLVTTLPTGTNPITAIYAGDQNYAASTSPDPEVVVLDRRDVNRDGSITPLDALLVVNALNSSPTVSNSFAASTGADTLDVNGDGKVTPLDALLILNYLNNPPAQQSAAPNVTTAVAMPAAMSAVAFGISSSPDPGAKTRHSAATDALFAAYPDLEL